jgi:hypothetical protein
MTDIFVEHPYLSSMIVTYENTTMIRERLDQKALLRNHARWQRCSRDTLWLLIHIRLPNHSTIINYMLLLQEKHIRKVNVLLLVNCNNAFFPLIKFSFHMKAVTVAAIKTHCAKETFEWDNQKVPYFHQRKKLNFSCQWQKILAGKNYHKKVAIFQIPAKITILVDTTPNIYVG